MTGWDTLFSGLVEYSTTILFVLLLVCIVGLVRELMGREDGKGG